MVSFPFTKLHYSFKNIQTGVEVFCILKFVSKEMIDSDLFKEIAPTSDDIWFWGAAVANGTYIIPFLW